MRHIEEIILLVASDVLAGEILRADVEDAIGRPYEDDLADGEVVLVATMYGVTVKALADRALAEVAAVWPWDVERYRAFIANRLTAAKDLARAAGDRRWKPEHILRASGFASPQVSTALSGYRTFGIARLLRLCTGLGLDLHDVVPREIPDLYAYPYSETLKQYAHTDPSRREEPVHPADGAGYVWVPAKA